MSEMDLHEGSVPESPDETDAPSTDLADDPEAPEADAMEQHTEVRPSGEQPVFSAPDDVDPADHAEQQRVVALDEDDYR